MQGRVELVVVLRLLFSWALPPPIALTPALPAEHGCFTTAEGSAAHERTHEGQMLARRREELVPVGGAELSGGRTAASCPPCSHRIAPA